jgi:OsmC-like protein
MPIVFGEMAASVEDIVAAFERHGDRVRGTYRAHYRFDSTTRDPYHAPRLERPESLRGNPPEAVFPWEQIFTAAAACAGSDYPMLAAHFGVPLERVDFVVEGVFDPRWEFEGLGGFSSPNDARHCYPALHLRVTLVSSAPTEELERIHAHVMSHNMVLDALRGVPQTNELVTLPSRARAEAMAGAGGVR